MAEAGDGAQSSHVEDATSLKPRFDKNDEPLDTIEEITRILAPVLSECKIQRLRVKLLGGAP